LTVTISPTIDSELHSGFKFATPTETLNIASGTVSKFNITYNCDSAGEEAWGKLGLRVTAFEILSQKTTTYEFTYTKICSASGLQWFDASYVVVMMVSFLFVIFFSNENVQEDFVNRDTRFSPLHIVLFFGAGTSFMIIIVLLREFMIGFMMLAFLLCSASATFLFF